MGLSRKAFERTVYKAWKEGVRYGQVKAPIRRYLAAIFLRKKSVNNPIIYGRFVFLFENTTLLTIYRIPNEYVKYL
jgi:hypothetical protein